MSRVAGVGALRGILPQATIYVHACIHGGGVEGDDDAARRVANSLAALRGGGARRFT